MRKFLAIIVFASAGNLIPAQAQVKIGVQVGANVTKVTWQLKHFEDNFSKKNRNGFSAGITADVTLPLVGLGVDAAILYGNRTVTVPQIGEASNKTFQYLDIPVDLKYTFGFSRMMSAFVSTGPQITYNLSDRSWSVDENTIVQWAEGWELSKSDLSWNFSGGFTFLQHYRVAYTYNVLLGNTNEFTIRKLGGDIQEGKLNENSHKLSFTYFF